MVSHLSDGAVRVSLICNSRAAHYAASISTSVFVPASSRLTPPRPRPSRASAYSSCAFAHAKAPVAQSTRSITSPPRSISSSSATYRSYATASGPQPPQDIAVLGGGLTGLTTAYYITRFHPDAKITIYEAADRLGGWIDTERVEVKTQQGDTATITFERGARSVSPQGGLTKWEDFVLYDMVWRSFLTMGKYVPC